MSVDDAAADPADPRMEVPRLRAWDRGATLGGAVDAVEGGSWDGCRVLACGAR